jgi:Outer membrane protein beta-barrel domain
MLSQRTGSQSSSRFTARAVARVAVALLCVTGSSVALAQEVRWSWFEVSFVQQDISQQGSKTDLVLGQTVDVDAKDGSGIKFRASLGTWRNMFAFVDFNSSDITVDAVVSNAGGVFPATDEFDYTAIRGGVGLKWSMTHSTDLYGAVSYDSTDFDFGSFAGENFDTGDKGIGAEFGVRSMFGDKLELRFRARYSGVGAVDLSTGVLDSDTLFGVGFGYELVRGLSIVGDFETGEFGSYNLGFRLDLSED